MYMFVCTLHMFLQENGVTFNIHGKLYIFRGSLALVAVDNLASHFLGGYKSLSSALRKCRHCMATADNMATEVQCTYSYIHSNWETHASQCASLDDPLYDHFATTYGLQRDSILNTSCYFHITEGLVPDVMHDVLEGCLAYEVKELLKHIINTRLSELDPIISIFGT